jgi:hypothetical protein
MVGFESQEVQASRPLAPDIRRGIDSAREVPSNLCRVKRVSATPDNFEQQLKGSDGGVEAKTSRT